MNIYLRDVYRGSHKLRSCRYGHLHGGANRFVENKLYTFPTRLVHCFICELILPQLSAQPIGTADVILKHVT